MKNLIALFFISMSFESIAQNEVIEVHQDYYSLYTDNLKLISTSGDTLLINAWIDNKERLYLTFDDTNYKDSLVTIITDVENIQLKGKNFNGVINLPLDKFQKGRLNAQYARIVEIGQKRFILKEDYKKQIIKALDALAIEIR